MNFYPIPEWFSKKIRKKYDDNLGHQIEEKILSNKDFNFPYIENFIKGIIAWSKGFSKLFIPVYIYGTPQNITISINGRDFTCSNPHHNLGYNNHVANALEDGYLYLGLNKTSYQFRDFLHYAERDFKKVYQEYTDYFKDLSKEIDELVENHEDNISELIDNEWFEYNMRRILKFNKGQYEPQANPIIKIKK